MNQIKTKQQLYDNIIKQVSNVIETCLNETYGIKEYDNKEYDNEINSIANDILNHFSNTLEYNAILLENDEEFCYLQQLNYKLKSIDWLELLHVYITTTPINSYENDTMVITNQVYIYNNQLNKSNIIPCNYNFQIINNNNEIIEPFIINRDIVKHASIIITVPNITKIYNVDELAAILKHELSHIYDAYSSQLSLNEINTDLMELDSFLKLPYKLEQNIELLLNSNISIYKKRNIIKTLDENILHNIFVENIYLLNKSELRARLQNCRYEIKKNIHILDSKIINIDLMQDRLRLISKQFNTYFTLYELFNLFIKYIPNNIKEKFTENSIKEQFGKQRPNYYEPKYPYNKSFKNNKNDYDISSFDKFFTYHIDNIYNIFLKNAISIFNDYFYQNETSALKIMSENYYLRKNIT